MASPKSATVQVNENAATPEVAASPESLRIASEARAKARKELIASLSFDELSAAIMTKAHWSDVLNAADRLANMIERIGANEKTATAQARKLGTLAPSDVWHFRMAITTYVLSGRTTNGTQDAELGAKLPSLVKSGELKAGEKTFGGLIIPSVLAKL